MGLTHKQQFNKKHNQNINKSNSMSELSKISKIPLTILREVKKRGEGAWKSNIKSVRTKKTFRKNEDLPRNMKLSARQWGLARVYAFINKIEKKSKLNHDLDLFRKLSK